MAVLLYIHGFLSSPRSHKAQQVQEWLQASQPQIQFCCPALSAHPAQAIATLKQLVEAHLPQPVYLLGSSLGGFYATWLGEQYGLRAVLVNPAVAPYRLISGYLHRDLKNYHTDEHHRLEAADIEALRALETDGLQYPANYWLMVQTGDESLDYRQAVDKYRDCRQLVEEGGDHSFQEFQRWLPDILQFFTQ